MSADSADHPAKLIFLRGEASTDSFMQIIGGKSCMASSLTPSLYQKVRRASSMRLPKNNKSSRARSDIFQTTQMTKDNQCRYRSFHGRNTRREILHFPRHHQEKSAQYCQWWQMIACQLPSAALLLELWSTLLLASTWPETLFPRLKMEQRLLRREVR